MHNPRVLIPNDILSQECPAAYMQWLFAFQLLEPKIGTYDWALLNDTKVDAASFNTSSPLLTQAELDDYLGAHNNLVNLFFEKTGIEITLSDETTYVDEDYNEINSKFPVWVTGIVLNEKLLKYEGTLIGSRY